MFYAVTGVLLIIAMALGFYCTLRVDKKLEKEES